MENWQFTRKLHRYFRQHTPLVNPKVALDWINDTGWESKIFAFTLTHGRKLERQSKRCVLRLLTGANFEAAESEFRMVSLLHTAGYPVPEPYRLGAPEEGFGRPFIIMQCMSGGHFADRFSKGLLSDDESLRQFIALFRRLHTLDWRAYVPDHDLVSPPDEPCFHYNQKLSNYASLVAESGLRVLDPVLDWLTVQRGAASCDRASVVHMDFHPDNILEDEAGRLYVIDWSAADISDYRFDLAWTLTLAAVYQGLEAREMILGEYERQMGKKVEALEIFEVVALLRRIGSIMISLGAGSEMLGMRPQTVSVMRQEQEPLLRCYERLVALTGLDLSDIRRQLERLWTAA